MDAEWFGALGQWAGAVATVTAVWVALRIANRDSRRREAEDEQRALNIANLVLVGTPASDDEGMFIDFTNHSGRLMLNVHAEVWAPGTDGSERPRWAVQDAVVQPGEPGRWRLGRPGSAAIGAWRLRWTDSEGRRWYVDEHSQRPRPYKGGPPRLHPGQIDR